MNEISKDWTAEERLKVVAEIAREMSQMSSYHQVEWAERLRFLATASASFLEANRANIINAPSKLYGLEERPQ